MSPDSNRYHEYIIHMRNLNKIMIKKIGNGVQ